MEVTYTTHDGRMTAKIDGDDQKSIVEKIAAFSEVFEFEPCGKCDGTDIRFRVRKVADTKGKQHTYYEKKCFHCGAKLQFGQHSEGGSLFPKRYDSEKNESIGKYGWVKFNKESGQDE